MKRESMSCERALALLTRYGDGELEESLAAPLRGHLLDCAACRAAAVETKNLRAWMEPLEAPPVPAGFAAKVARAAFAGGAEAPEPVAVGAGLSSFVLAATALAAGVLFSLALALGMSARPSGGSLVAEPYHEALELLEELNREELAEDDRPSGDAQDDR